MGHIKIKWLGHASFLITSDPGVKIVTDPYTPDGQLSYKRVDVLLIPAGGFFTLEPDDIDKVVDRVKPKIVIPMHYQTDKTKLPFSGVDKFIKNKANVEKRDSSEIAVEPDTLPKSTKIVVLKPAN